MRLRVGRTAGLPWEASVRRSTIHNRAHSRRFWLGGLPRRHSRLALLCYTFCFCLAGGGLGWEKELEDFARAEESRCEDPSSADGRGRHDYRRQRDPALAARWFGARDQNV